MRWFYPPPPWLKHLISQPSEATDAVSVGEIASELEMTARPEHDRDDDEFDPEDAEAELLPLHLPKIEVVNATETNEVLQRT